MQVSLTTAMSPDLFRADEPMARKPERAEASFVDTIVGCRGGLRSILSQLKAVAPTIATVLITGETGTGKSVIAQAVHELSPRRTKNLVKLNCAAMPAGLLDSELFGHVRGAFTGAIRSHTGRLKLADGGTLFLDEIGDMPLELQPKLLRVIREHEFEAVGSTRTTPVDVRVIAAMTGDLWQMVQDRKREQLAARNYCWLAGGLHYLVGRSSNATCPTDRVKRRSNRRRRKEDTMKSLLYVAVALIAIYALGNSRAVAQDTSSQATASSAGGADAFVDQQFALLRKDIRSVKKQLIAANLTLSDNEAAKFWPVYDQYSTELSKINDTRTAIANRINLFQLAER
jgi:sigma54-dependent transcription regulator